MSAGMRRLKDAAAAVESFCANICPAVDIVVVCTVRVVHVGYVTTVQRPLRTGIAF